MMIKLQLKRQRSDASEEVCDEEQELTKAAEEYPKVLMKPI